MNEEEAIQKLHDLTVQTGLCYQELETVLNLLEKKDKEIQFQKDINKTEQDRHKKTEKSLKGQIIKQNKIIDEMAMSLYDYANLEVVINCPAEYDENYDLSKCRMNLADRNCINCIKQYFERKVENEASI